MIISRFFVSIQEMIDVDVESVDLDGRVEHLSQHQTINHSIVDNRENRSIENENENENQIEDGHEIEDQIEDRNENEMKNEDLIEHKVKLKVKMELRLIMVFIYQETNVDF